MQYQVQHRRVEAEDLWVGTVRLVPKRDALSSPVWIATLICQLLGVADQLLQPFLEVAFLVPYPQWVDALEVLGAPFLASRHLHLSTVLIVRHSVLLHHRFHFRPIISSNEFRPAQEITAAESGYRILAAKIHVALTQWLLGYG